VFLKLDDRLETEGGGGDLWLEDPNEVGGGCFREVDDNRLRGDRDVSLLTDSFGEGGAGETDVETRLDTTLRSSQGNRRGGGRRLEVLTYQLTPYAED
jgi:hypothetical protein